MVGLTHPSLLINYAAFYERLHSALKYVLWVRCPLVVILIVCELLEQRIGIIIISLIGKSLLTSTIHQFNPPPPSSLLTFLLFTGLAILANAFVSLIVFFHAIYEPSKNIGGLAKLILLKASVVLIVAQGMFCIHFCMYVHEHVMVQCSFHTTNL